MFLSAERIAGKVKGVTYELVAHMLPTHE